MTATIERKYALIKIKSGDYLLPSNDARKLWRIATYVDGPSMGLDWPCDRTFWGVWECRGAMDSDMTGLLDEWDRWEMWSGMHDTRTDAISTALGAS